MGFLSDAETLVVHKSLINSLFHTVCSAASALKEAAVQLIVGRWCCFYGPWLFSFGSTFHCICSEKTNSVIFYTFCF